MNRNATSYTDTERLAREASDRISASRVDVNVTDEKVIVVNGKRKPTWFRIVQTARGTWGLTDRAFRTIQHLLDGGEFAERETPGGVLDLMTRVFNKPEARELVPR